jgi:hypothetical protein
MIWLSSSRDSDHHGVAQNQSREKHIGVTTSG